LTGGDVQQAKRTGTDDALLEAVSPVESERKNNAKSLSAPLSAPSAGERNSAKPNGIYANAQNAEKQGFEGKITHSKGHERTPSKSVQKWRRGFEPLATNSQRIEK